MTINDIVNSGLQGLAQAQSQMEHATEAIAHSSSGSNAEIVALASSLTELKAAENHAAASSKVVKAATDMIGTILDTVA